VSLPNDRISVEVRCVEIPGSTVQAKAETVPDEMIAPDELR
jgi:hypothetical protein